MAMAAQTLSTLDVTAPDADMDALSDVSRMDHDNDTFDFEIVEAEKADHDGDYMLEDPAGTPLPGEIKVDDDEMLDEPNQIEDSLIADVDDTVYDDLPLQDEILDDASDTEPDLHNQQLSDATALTDTFADDTFITAFEDQTGYDLNDHAAIAETDPIEDYGQSENYLNDGLVSDNTLVDGDHRNGAHSNLTTYEDDTAVDYDNSAALANDEDRHFDADSVADAAGDDNLTAEPLVDLSAQTTNLASLGSEIDLPTTNTSAIGLEDNDDPSHAGQNPRSLGSGSEAEVEVDPDQLSNEHADVVGTAFDNSASPVAHEASIATDEPTSNPQNEVPTILINYYDDEFALFPPAASYPSLAEYADYSHLVDDVNFFSKSIGELLIECRRILGDIEEDQELELEIPDLGLLISEEHSSCSQCSIEQIVSIFHTLNANDGHEEMQPLHAKLISRTKFSTRFAMLQQSVNEQKGLSELAYLNSMYDDPTAETDLNVDGIGDVSGNTSSRHGSASGDRFEGIVANEMENEHADKDFLPSANDDLQQSQGHLPHEERSVQDTQDAQDREINQIPEAAELDELAGATKHQSWEQQEATDDAVQLQPYSANDPAQSRTLRTGSADDNGNSTQAAEDHFTDDNPQLTNADEGRTGLIVAEDVHNGDVQAPSGTAEYTYSVEESNNDHTSSYLEDALIVPGVQPNANKSHLETGTENYNAPTPNEVDEQQGQGSQEFDHSAADHQWDNDQLHDFSDQPEYNLEDQSVAATINAEPFVANEDDEQNAGGAEEDHDEDDITYEDDEEEHIPTNVADLATQEINGDQTDVIKGQTQLNEDHSGRKRPRDDKDASDATVSPQVGSPKRARLDNGES